MLKISTMKLFLLISSLFLCQFVTFIRSWQPCPTNCICSSLDDSPTTTATCNQFPSIEEFNNDLNVLKIESSEICPIPKSLQQFTQLKALSVSNCATDVNSNNFKNLAHLESVTFHNTGMINFDPSSFEFNENLKSVNLSSNPLIIWRHVLVSASVEEIDLSNCGLSEIPKKAFSQILNLKRLILRDNRLKTLNIILPDSINYLDLSNNIMQDLSLRALKPLVNLKEIEISGNPLICSCKLKLVEKFLSFRNVFVAKAIECIAPSKEIIPLETLSLRDLCKLRANLDEDVFVANLLQRLRRSVATINANFEESSSQSVHSKGSSGENFTPSAYLLPAKMNFKDGDDVLSGNIEDSKMVIDQGFMPDAPLEVSAGNIEDTKMVIDQGFIPDDPEVPAGEIITPPPLNMPPPPEVPHSEQEARVSEPGRPDFAPKRPDIAPERPDFAPKRPDFAPERPDFAPKRPDFAPERPDFGPQRPDFAPERPDFAPKRPDFAPERPDFPPNRPDPPPAHWAPGHEPEPMPQHTPEPEAPIFSLRIVIIILALMITVLLLLVIAIVVALVLKMLSAKSDDDSFQESGDNEDGSSIPMLSRRCSTRKGTCRICPSTMSSRRSGRSSKYCQNGEISDCETVANESQFDCATSGNVTSACTTFERSRRC